MDQERVPEYCYYLSDGYPSMQPPSDTEPLSLTQCYGVSTPTFVQRVSGKADYKISALVVDLLSVARGIFAADCLSLRKINAPGYRDWQRKITLTIPVHDIDHWQCPQIVETLSSALAVLSGDCWHFQFVPTNELMPVTQGCLPFPEERQVGLFSEGLDSFSGLALRLASDDTATFAVVSAIIQKQCRPRIKAAIHFLNKSYGNRVSHVPLRLCRKESLNHGPEDTWQRSRSFLLVCLATSIALLIGQNTVEVYENGIEAFNFPFEEGLVAGQASRAMNPVFLARMKCFISALTGTPIEFRLPFLFDTKQAMVRQLTKLAIKPNLMEGDRESGIAHAIHNTVSCMHFPQRKSGAKQCGLCEGCVLRRITFQSNEWCDDTGQYQADFGRDSPAYGKLICHLLRLEEALAQAHPFEALLHGSGFGQRAQPEFQRAAAEVGSVSPVELPARMIALFTHHARQCRGFFDSLPTMDRYSSGYTT